MLDITCNNKSPSFVWANRVINVMSQRPLYVVSLPSPDCFNFSTSFRLGNFLCNKIPHSIERSLGEGWKKRKLLNCGYFCGKVE